MNINDQAELIVKKIYSIQNRGDKGMKLIIFFGALGDFDSIEYAQRISKIIPLLKLSSIKLWAIGIGDESSKVRFCSYTRFPLESLVLENDASFHRLLGLSPGLDLPVEPLLNLILMCAGIGSKGTLTEVLRGYVGDRSSAQIFNNDDSIRIFSPITFKGSLFKKAGGIGFLRPFELATLRLKNMIEVISNWPTYMPNRKVLTQRGATFLLGRNHEVLYSYCPKSLLSYSENMSDPLCFLEPWLNA